MRSGTHALLGLLALGCVTTTRRVELERPVVSERGETAWFVEVWEDRAGDRVEQRTTVVICRPDRTPPCVRAEPATLRSRTQLEEWVGSEPGECPGDSEADED